MPLVEAFYKQVPVLAYAATAVPATMDGAGVLYDDKDPLHVAALMDAILSDAAAAGRDRRRPARRPSSGCRRKDFDGTLLGFVDEILASPRAAGAARRLRLLAAVRRRRRARGAPAVPAVDLQGAAGEPAVIVNQWVPAAHKGRRDRRQRPAHARPAARAWATSPSSTR